MLKIPGFGGDKGYRWSFFRAGGFDQVRLTSGEDIRNLDKLDPKLWSALSCPTKGVFFDARTLELLDTDKDGRIRHPEIIAASKWVCSLLKDPQILLKEKPGLPLDQINDETDEGKRVLASAKQILVNLGKPDATEITIDDTTDTVRIFAQTRFNGDGIVPPDSSDDAFIQGVIKDCISLYGSAADRSGKQGIDTDRFTRFMADLEAYSAWYKRAQDNAGEIWFIGERQTAEAYAAYVAVMTKIDDYYARCRLAAYDPRAQAALNRHETEYLTVAANDLKITADEVAGFPLARIVADQPLSLTTAMNPAWVNRMAVFREKAVTPIVGDVTSLSEADYLKIKGRFAAHAAWLASKPAVSIEKLGIARVSEILASNAKTAVADLLQADKRLEPEVNAITHVDKLVRLNRYFYRLLVNFVNFRDFYDLDGEMSIFQAGTLYLDQRSCDLCVKVDDMTRHASLAPMSRVYLAYCDCVRRGGTDKMTIAAAFTAGDSDNLMIGRNGVFYDRKEQDWDATIVKVFENPISIRQAFWSPYKRVIRWVEEQIAKRAAAADTSSTQMLTSAAGTALDASIKGTPTKVAPKIDLSTIALLGVAVSGVTAVVGAVLEGFFKLGMLMPLGVAGVMLGISGPSMIIAWLKLRQRNLGPLLDANGWAINTRARVNIAFGARLTGVAKLPPGAKYSIRDPFADSKQGRVWAVIILTSVIVFCIVVIMYRSGLLDAPIQNVRDAIGAATQPATQQAPSVAK